MAFTPYTGKQYGATVTFNSLPILGWQEIVIKEDGKPLADQQDITTAASSAFAYQADPLGGKGTPKTTVTVSGLLARTDFSGADGITDFALNSTYNLIVRKGTGAGKDTFTESMTLIDRSDNHAHAGKFVDYSLTFEANSAIAWTTTLS